MSGGRGAWAPLGRRIAVTGATGFLGGHLVTALLDAGAQVRCVVRSPQKADWLVQRGATVAVADLAEPAALTQAFEGVDVVVANAALSPGWARHDREAFGRANVEGTRNTLGAAVKAGVQRVVKISTVAVQPTRLFRPMVEAPPGLDGFSWSAFTTSQEYARSKAEAEALAWEMAEAHDLLLTVLRPGPVYGPRDPKLTARYARWMGRPVLPAPTVGIPHVHAGDVALALLGALSNDASIGNAYLLAGEPVSVHRLLRTWRRLAGRGPWLLPLPIPVSVRYDCAAAARDLGFQPRSLEEGLRDVLASLASD